MRAAQAAWLNTSESSSPKSAMTSFAAPCPSMAALVSPIGLLHGGASVALAETLGSTGATMCVDAEDYLCVGQEINANHVRAARTGLVTGTARPEHLGGRTQVWTIDIVNESWRTGLYVALDCGRHRAAPRRLSCAGI